MVAEALDIVAKKEYRREDSECFRSARMHILCIAGGKAYSSPEGCSVVDYNPCETAAVVFLERRIANNCNGLSLKAELVKSVCRLQSGDWSEEWFLPGWQGAAELLGKRLEKLHGCVGWCRLVRVHNRKLDPSIMLVGRRNRASVE